MTARRHYRRNLLALGYERAARFILTAIRYSPNGGRKSVYVAGDGGISIYPVNNPGCERKPTGELVGVYGSDVLLEYLEDDLLQRQRELSGPANNLRHNRKQD
jgi:hypothetical protein